MLYEIRERTGKRPFRLFLKKKKGLKFKQSFHSLEYANWFIETHLRHCCLSCKENGWVYKTQLPKPFRSSLKGGTKRFPVVGVITICPECRTQHRVQHENIQYEFNGQVYSCVRTFLVQIRD